jgi:hypothetical protein
VTASVAIPQIDVLTHISPFWRTYESNDINLEKSGTIWGLLLLGTQLRT